MPQHLVDRWPDLRVRVEHSGQEVEQLGWPDLVGRHADLGQALDERAPALCRIALGFVNGLAEVGQELLCSLHLPLVAIATSTALAQSATVMTKAAGSFIMNSVIEAGSGDDPSTDWNAVAFGTQ